MNKADLVNSVAGKVPNLSQEKANEVVNAVIASIEEAMIAQEDVRLANFGTFSVKHVAERQGFNIAKQEKMMIPAKDKVTFKPSDALQNKVNK